MFPASSCASNKIIACRDALRRPSVLFTGGAGGGAGDLRRCRRSGGFGGGVGVASGRSMAWRRNGGFAWVFGAALACVGTAMVGMAGQGRGFPPKIAALRITASFATRAGSAAYGVPMGGVAGPSAGGVAPPSTRAAPLYHPGGARQAPHNWPAFSAANIAALSRLIILTTHNPSWRKFAIEPLGRGRARADSAATLTQNPRQIVLQANRRVGVHRLHPVATGARA